MRLGIVNRYDDGTFRPNANITHAELIATVIHVSGLFAGGAKQTGFTDAADIPAWA